MTDEAEDRLIEWMRTATPWEREMGEHADQVAARYADLWREFHARGAGLATAEMDDALEAYEALRAFAPGAEWLDPRLRDESDS